MLDLLIILIVFVCISLFFISIDFSFFNAQPLLAAREIFWLISPILLVCIFILMFLHDTLFMLNAGILHDQIFLFINSYSQFSNAVLAVLIASFITITVFFTLSLTRPQQAISSINKNLFFLFIVSCFFLFNKSFIWLLIAFECLLLISLNILKLTSKSERIGEALSEMFMWTLFGSFFLLMGFFLLIQEIGVHAALSLDLSSTSKISSEWPILSLFFLIGFGVKIPIWPFFSWLLKAHVEASVEFSILLSGFIVKLGVIGLWRILDFLAPDSFIFVIIALSCLGIFEAAIRLFAQNDLKKIVALTTVIEMNWLNLCYFLGDANLTFLANFLLVAHCFTTTSEFLLVEYISKRYGTRDFWHISGLWYKTPNLWYLSFFVIFITIGFPGSSIFFAKFLFLSVLLSYSVLLFCFFLLIFFLVLPLFFVRLWVPVWFGLPTVAQHSAVTTLIVDLTSKELILIIIPIFFSVLLGFYPTFFFGIA